MTDQVCVGAIAGSYGVRGEVRLKSFCADPEAIAGYSPLTGDNGVSYSVTLSRATACPPPKMTNITMPT